MDNLYKFYVYTKKYGIRGSIRKTLEYINRKTKTIKRPIDIMVAVDDVIKSDYIHNPYEAPSKKNKSKLKIGWVLSPLSPGSGGQNTIVRFARYLQESGHSITFYIYEGIQAQSTQEAKKILRSSFKFDVRVKKIEAYEESDALIATGWETAYPVFNINTKAHKLYFVQDFEPYFYGLGSKYILAENTYRMNLYGITAGPWLTQKVGRYGMKADFFDFGADLEIYRPKGEVIKKKKICFYARPVTERRAFEVGILALDIFNKKHPDYEIEFIGWDVSEFEIPFKYVNRGVLSHDKLAELYHESVACLVLSLTNVSLLPLELIAAGCIPVMNDGDNNRMVLKGRDSYVDYVSCSPIELAEALSRAVERKNIKQYALRAVKSVSSLSWDGSYKKVEKIILREVAGR